jgi:hypothetical protein
MNDIRKKENIEELRKRLYSREVVEPKLRRHDLTNEQANVATE